MFLKLYYKPDDPIWSAILLHWIACAPHELPPNVPLVRDSSYNIDIERVSLFGVVHIVKARESILTID